MTEFHQAACECEVLLNACRLVVPASFCLRSARDGSEVSCGPVIWRKFGHKGDPYPSLKARPQAVWLSF